MNRLTSFLRQDISALVKQRPKKLSLVRQRKMIELFTNLLTSGFHLVEIVDFLKKSQLLADCYTNLLYQGLLAGKPFAVLLSDLQFSDAVVTQVALAEVHGNLELSLTHIQDYLGNLVKVRKKLVEVATYPVILLLFLLVIMLGLKSYLLPQLEEGSGARTIINLLPLVFLVSAVIGLALVVLLSYCYRRSEKIKTVSLLAGLPFAGRLLQLYLTAYYAREWGNLIGQGLEMTQIVELMQHQQSDLFRRIGRELGLALERGVAFEEHIKHYPFFKKELSLMIEYGQVKDKLGHELRLYANECWEEFFAKLNTAMQLIQPMVFLFVAVIVVLIYVAMLLPIYQNLEV
ncbi:competence type IV pilus assembly protein ComGB [Streptococcus respiraculi]|uniref:competence type IV pilus assembly protein ComGB n=1 Tax=Streptococcus respiraculi TaxID=2021971 RepID=UPI000E765DE8|nr:competence type IV pilus assembly protein ComGB [Streptococcus respiraculi]